MDREEAKKVYEQCRAYLFNPPSEWAVHRIPDCPCGVDDHHVVYCTAVEPTDFIITEPFMSIN